MLRRLILAVCAFAVLAGLAWAQPPRPPVGPQPVTAIKAGRLIDPESGTAASNQIIVVEGDTIKAVGPNVQIPPGATVIDLSKLTVLPGLVDAHEHLAMTMKDVPESNYYYLTYIMDSSPLRAIQAASNGIQLLASGFTVIRDLGNSGLYTDTAVRQAIEQGWIPGPTVINSGIMISGRGGQFWPTPEMDKYHNILYPEYIDADSHDEIVKAVRENALFGARIIKVMVDAKPWGYSVDELKLFITEAAKAGLRVAGHVGSAEGLRRAIDAGIWSVEHGGGLTDETARLMAQKGIWLAGTETPLTPYRGTQAGFERSINKLKLAYANKVPLTFSTDLAYWNEKMRDEKTGEWLTRGDLTINFLLTWKAAGIPAPDILRAMTINGYKCAEVDKVRGPIKPGLKADIIAVPGNPLEDIDALRKVQFVMKEGMVFKRDGAMTPGKFFHPGPVNGWRIR